MTPTVDVSRPADSYRVLEMQAGAASEATPRLTPLI